MGQRVAQGLHPPATESILRSQLRTSGGVDIVPLDLGLRQILAGTRQHVNVISSGSVRIDASRDALRAYPTALFDLYGQPRRASDGVVCCAVQPPSRHHMMGEVL